MTEYRNCSILLNGDENFTITIDGKTFTTKEIIQRMKEIKMTREEAIQKFSAASEKNKAESGVIISGLEALGLIKFDEPVTSFICGVPTSVLIETLKNNGYTVIKNA